MFKSLTFEYRKTDLFCFEKYGLLKVQSCKFVVFQNVFSSRNHQSYPGSSGISLFQEYIQNHMFLKKNFSKVK